MSKLLREFVRLSLNEQVEPAAGAIEVEMTHLFYVRKDKAFCGRRDSVLDYFDEVELELLTKPQTNKKLAKLVLQDVEQARNKIEGSDAKTVCVVPKSKSVKRKRSSPELRKAIADSIKDHERYHSHLEWKNNRFWSAAAVMGRKLCGESWTILVHAMGEIHDLNSSDPDCINELLARVAQIQHAPDFAKPYITRIACTKTRWEKLVPHMEQVLAKIGPVEKFVASAQERAEATKMPSKAV